MKTPCKISSDIDNLHKRGRPSKYKPEYTAALIEHFESYLQEPFTREVIKRRTVFKSNGDKIVDEDFKLVSKALPSLFSFAREIGVSYRTLLRWSKERVGKPPEAGEKDSRRFLYEEFCHAYKDRLQYQEEFLSRVGLGGIAPAAYAIFTAKNVLGWRDTQDQRFLSDRGEPITPGYIILPHRMTEEEAEADYTKSLAT